MPRNITVTFADGSSHVYQNAPDNITPGQVAARATKEFGKQISNIDGGRQAAPPQMTQPTRNAPAVPVTTKAQEIQNLAKKYVDQQEQNSAAPTGISRFQNATTGAVGRMLFGLPERIQAAGDYYFHGPSRSDRPQMNSYSDQLALERAITDEQRRRSAAGNIIGTVGGALTSGSAEAKGLQLGGKLLARSGAPIVAKAGNIIADLTQLKKGQNVKNAVKLATTGAAGGASQAAGEGSDVGEGAAYGAGGALLLGAGAKLVKGGAKLVRNITRPASQDVDQALREVVTEDPAAIAARQADLQAKTGAPVPPVAALNDQDFANVSNKVIKDSPEAAQIAKSKTGDYIRGFMDRMLGHVNAAGQAADAQQVSGIGDLAEIRKNTADDLMGPVRDKTVDISTLPLDDLERQVTKQIGGRITGLGPRLNAALKDIPPDALASQDLTGEDAAKARALLNHFGMGQPVEASVSELDNLRRTLEAAGRSSAASNPANALAYRNAAKTIGDFVAEKFPEYRQMLDTYAKQSRMMEGFDAASKGQRPADIEDNQLRANLQTPEGRVGLKAGELYRLRQAASAKPTSAIALAHDLGAEGKLTRPASIAPDAAQPGTVTENLGDKPAANLATAAQGETDVLGRMLDTNKLNAAAADEGANTLSPAELAVAAMPGHPIAKANVIKKLLGVLPRGFNPNVASNMVDMLYSGDPDKTRQVMNALQSVGIGQQAVQDLMANGGAVGAAAGAANADAQAPDTVQPQPAPSIDIPELDMGEPAPDSSAQNNSGTGAIAPAGGGFLPKIEAPAGVAQYAQDGSPLVGFGQDGTPQYGTPDQPDARPPFDPNRPYGRQVVEQLFPNAEITDDVRDPNSKLGRENPNSYHNTTQNAVDVKPIPGMQFKDFIQKLHDNGYDIVEAIDEVNHPSRFATGPHWHVVIGGQ